MRVDKMRMVDCVVLRASCSLAAVLALVFSAPAATGAVFSQLGDEASYTLEDNGTVFNPVNTPGTTSLIIGNLSDGSKYNAVYIFAVPALPAGDVVATADLELRASVAPGTTFNADLHGIGFQNSIDPVLDFWNSNLPESGAIKLQDNILTPGIGSGFELHTDTVGGAALAAYLQAFYSANPAYAGGEYVFLRLNPDADPGSVNEYYTVGAAPLDGLPILTITTLAVPEPSTFAMAFLALIGISITARRRGARASG
jgi:hypothetical protein